MVRPRVVRESGEWGGLLPPPSSQARSTLEEGPPDSVEGRRGSFPDRVRVDPTRVGSRMGGPERANSPSGRPTRPLSTDRPGRRDVGTGPASLFGLARGRVCPLGWGPGRHPVHTGGRWGCVRSPSHRLRPDRERRRDFVVDGEGSGLDP